MELTVIGCGVLVGRFAEPCAEHGQDLRERGLHDPGQLQLRRGQLFDDQSNYQPTANSSASCGIPEHTLARQTSPRVQQ